MARTGGTRRVAQVEYRAGYFRIWRGSWSDLKIYLAAKRTQNRDSPAVVPFAAKRNQTRVKISYKTLHRMARTGGTRRVAQVEYCRTWRGSWSDSKTPFAVKRTQNRGSDPLLSPRLVY